MTKAWAKFIVLFVALQTCRSTFADDTNSERVKPVPLKIPIHAGETASFIDYLFSNGSKLGCHFTLEYTSYELAGHMSRLYSYVTNDTGAATVQVFIANLRRQLPEFDVEQDAKHQDVVHIIERSLVTNESYVLNQKISLKYSGDLCPCMVKDAEGNNLTSGVGLVDLISSEMGGIATGTEEAGSQGAFSDCWTRVEVTATNETARSILTDSLPLDKYKPILWRAVLSADNADKRKRTVLVQYYGQKMSQL